jgi:hypothetical protein
MAAIAAVLIGASAPTLVRTWSGKKNPDDFAVVYSGARAMWDRQDIYAATSGMYIYSPFLAFIFQPLALLPQRAASLVWIVISALILLAAAFLAAAKVSESWRYKIEPLGPPSRWIISAGALLLSFEKIRSDFTLGQTDCLIIIGLVGALIWMNRRPLIAGIVVGATANVKYLALIFVPYFIIKRNYRAAISAIVSFAFFFALPAAEAGFGFLKTYAIDATAVLARVAGIQTIIPARTDNPVVNAITWDHSISLTSAILRETRAHEASDGIAAAIILVLFVLLMAGAVLVGRCRGVKLFRPLNRIPSSDDRVITIEWAVLIVLALVFGPQTTARHMIVLLLVFAVALALLLTQKRGSGRVFLLASMIATALALLLPFRDTGVHPLLITLKSAGVASWCAVALTFAIVWVGSRAISEAADPVQEISIREMDDAH